MMGSSASSTSKDGSGEGVSLIGSSESLPLSTGTRSYRSYGSLFNYYGFLRKNLSPSTKTLNRSDSMVSLSHRALAGYILEDDFQGFQAFLANKRVLVDDRDENGATVLHLAAGRGKLNFVRELLNHGADINAEDSDNWCALLCAAKEGHTEVCIEMLERDANIEHRDMGGWTALMWASYRGHMVTALMLVERGADINAHGNYHISSLLWAAGRGHAEIAKILVQHGAKVNVGDKYGTTALVWASRKGNAEIVNYLLKAGANVDTAGMCDKAILYDEPTESKKLLSFEYSWTALLVATMGNHVDVVTLLLECKPNVNAVDKDGCTALTIACKEGYTEIATALLNTGAYINIQDRSGDTNLIHAVKGGHRSVVEALLKKYADVDIPGKDRKTATYNAVEKGNIPILKILLTSNPDLEISTKDGDTALLRAVRSRNTEAVHLLLERKARVSACDRWGDTGLHIAMRARSKAIVEILLRNPKNSQLLYRPNRAGETPYNIDMNHPKTILGQIFGARRLNTNEDNENLLGYDLYSSALADILSEPSLSMPITVGLYAKWGSGKSFLLNKLREEMQNFARQWVEPVIQFSWLLMAILAHVSVLFGLVLGLASSSWVIGITSSATVFALIYFFLLMLWYGSQSRYSWDMMYNMSVALTHKMNAIRVVLQVIFCHPPGAQWSDTITAQPIRFYFTDQTRVGSTAAGENSVVQMIGSLYDSIEADYGMLSTRLYRAFRPKSLKSTSSWRWRRLCCIPDIIMFEVCFVCVLALIAVLTIYLSELHLPASDVSIDRMTAHIVFGLCGTLVVMCVVANIYTVTCVLASVIMSQRHHLQRAIARVDTVKSEGFLQALRSEVSLMKDMVKCLDAFSQQQTRLVIIVDGLDSCEQDKVLLVLDAVHVLFSDANTPFIIILAIDPHIISKAVEANSRRLLSESNIGGHDYLRNMVHLPFFLQNSGLRKLKMAQKSATKKSLTAGYDTLADVGLVKSASARRLSSNEAMLSRSQERLKIVGNSGKGGGSGSGSGSGLKRLKLSDSIASSLGSNLNRAGGPHDLTKMLLTDDYFSDVNPRSMRRLMNVVYITGRLLKAFQIDFNWYHLASWVNITEQWPYRTSWLILYHDSTEDTLDDNMSLKTLYDKVRCHIPVSKDIEPLLELDRDERKLDIFLTFHRSNLLVGDLRIFLPFTINLDPYIKKVIKEDQQNMDDSFFTNAQQGQGQCTSSPGTSVWAPQSPDNAWSLYRKSPLTRKQSMKNLKRMMNVTPIHQMSPLVCQQSGQPMINPNHHHQWQVMTPATHHIPPAAAGTPYSPTPSPPPLPPELDEVNLESLNVTGVCDVVSKLTDLQHSHVPDYLNFIQANNINGKVLMHCDLNELKQVMKMSFGDWEIFRIVMLRLRDAALARRRLGSSPPVTAPPSVAVLPTANRNVRFTSSTSTNKPLQQSMTPPVPSEKDRSVTKQSIMEKQVTLEEQMICGALQTLNEEACEDVLEENEGGRQEPGEVLTFDRFGRVPSQTSCYSYSGNDETDIILLQCLPAGSTQWVGSNCGGGSSCSSAADTPIVLRKKQDQQPSLQSGSEVKLAVSSLPSSRPSSLLMTLMGNHTPATRSLSADDERTQSKMWNSSFWNPESQQKGMSMLTGLTASLSRRLNPGAESFVSGDGDEGGGSGDESTPLVSEHSNGGGGSLSPPSSSISSPSTPLGGGGPQQLAAQDHHHHCASSSSDESLSGVLSGAEEHQYSRGSGQQIVTSPHSRPPSLSRQYAIDIDEESPLMPHWTPDPETTV